MVQVLEIRSPCHSFSISLQYNDLPWCRLPPFRSSVFLLYQKVIWNVLKWRLASEIARVYSIMHSIKNLKNDQYVEYCVLSVQEEPELFRAAGHQLCFQSYQQHHAHSIILEYQILDLSLLQNSSDQQFRSKFLLWSNQFWKALYSEFFFHQLYFIKFFLHFDLICI